MTCAYKEYEVKIGIVQEPQLQLKNELGCKVKIVI